MSEGNVEIVRRFYEAWARGELPGPPELMDPAIEYVNPAGAVEPGIRRGLAAFGAVPVLRRVWRTFDRPPPPEPPPRYPIWPLWYAPHAFVHTRRAGALFVLGLAVAAVFKL